MKIILRKIKDFLLNFKWFQTSYANFKCRRLDSPLQHRESWGGALPSKTFYVIRRKNLWGIMSVATIYIRFIKYALERNWIPVVDLQSVDNLYNEGKGENSWEYFFEQPAGYTMQDISEAKNIVISGAFVYFPKRKDFGIDWNLLSNKKSVSEYRKLAEKYLRMKPCVKKFIDDCKKSLFKDIPPDKVVSVYCRGTDYIDLKPKNNPVQPSADDVIKKTQEVMEKFGAEYVYLVTEDERILRKFKDIFKDKLIYTDSQRWGNPSDKDDFIWKRKLNVSKKQNGIDYIRNMMLLSYGNYFIGGVTGGTAGFTLLNNKKFDFFYLFNLGEYK